MTQTTDPTTAAVPPAGAEGIRESLRGKYVCPFCGSVNDNEQGTCPRCTMENSAATRKATKTRIGPWYVLQTRNPAAPGMTWETLIGFIRKGRVKPRSIVRGPTTHQLWRFAAHVKGLSREFGICYSCGSNLEPTASLCATCNRLQDPPPNPDALLEASREAQQTYPTPPATIDGTVLAGTATIAGEVPGASTAAPAAPPPDDAEFVIPALGSFIPPEAATATPVAPVAPVADATAGRAVETARPGGEAAGVGAGSVPATPASTGPATPPGNYQGISGDPSWTRIGPGGDAARSRGGASGSQRPAGRPPNGTANPNAPKFNPYADDDLPSAAGGRREGEGFLSAKDLAAAFNLGFVGEEDDEDPRAASGRGGRAGRKKDARPEAMGFPGFDGIGGNAYAGGGSGRNRLKIALAIAILAIMGLGVAMAVSSDLRQTVKKWFTSLTAGLNKQGEGDQLGSPGSNRKKLDTPTGRRQPEEPPEPPAPRSNDPSTSPARGSESSENGAAPTSATRSAEVPAAHVATPPTVPPTAPPATRNATASSADHASVPASAPAAPASPLVSWAKSEAAKLYREGVAMENADPPLAMARYREIKNRFPKENWPSDLEDRIKRLEERLKKLAVELDRRP